MDALLALDPRAFADFVAAYLGSRGFTNVRRLGDAGDLGVDFRCTDAHGRRVFVHCRRGEPGAKVGLADVRRFGGLVVHAGAARGMVVTTSGLTAPAKKLAREQDIELIDGLALAVAYLELAGDDDDLLAPDDAGGPVPDHIRANKGPAGVLIAAVAIGCLVVAVLASLLIGVLP